MLCVSILILHFNFAWKFLHNSWQGSQCSLEASNSSKTSWAFLSTIPICDFTAPGLIQMTLYVQSSRSYSTPKTKINFVLLHTHSASLHTVFAPITLVWRTPILQNTTEHRDPCPMSVRNPMKNHRLVPTPSKLQTTKSKSRLHFSCKLKIRRQKGQS